MQLFEGETTDPNLTVLWYLLHIQLDNSVAFAENVGIKQQKNLTKLKKEHTGISSLVLSPGYSKTFCPFSAKSCGIEF